MLRLSIFQSFLKGFDHSVTEQLKAKEKMLWVQRMYFDRDYCGNIMDAIKASASMPFVTPMVNVDGIPGLDGGSCCKIPFQWAIEQGYEKIVIVKTREKGFRKTVSERRPAEKSQRQAC